MKPPTWSLALTTPLGPNALTLISFDGEEAISQPFAFTLLTAASSAYTDPAALLGKRIDVTLIGGDGIQRPFNGIVARLAQGHSQATIEMRPWLWLLTLSRNHRVFQNLAVADICAQVFADYPLAAVRNDLVLAYAKIEYCVQYGESDFDFVSRLLESAGIAYWFEHRAGVHTMVLVDDPAKFPPCPNAASVPWLAVGDTAEWLSDARIDAVELEQHAVPAGFRAADYNFTTPATALLGTAGQGKVYEYPGGFLLKADADAVSKRRDEELAALALVLRGTSPLRHLASGTNITVTGHPVTEFNARYVLRSVRHSAERRQYSNSFTAFPARVPFRPARTTPRPRIAGSQTALVVGPAGKEIWTDEYGRIKLQFHWDRQGRQDGDSSCWVRVSQSWSGKNWGAFSLPRVGQEVVVSFLEGDPDRPLVTGCIYNGDNPLPYALPENQSRSTMKSQSTPSATGFNELRFEDKAGAEELFLQAEKDLNVTVVKGDWTSAVETGNASHSVKGNSTIAIEGNAEETVKGNLTITVMGNVTIKASGSVAVEAGTGLTLKGGTTVAVEAGSALTLKGATVAITASATGSFDGGGMLELRGGVVKLN